jgi:hypothetical protein
VGADLPLAMTKPTDTKRFYSTQDARFTVEGGRGGVVKFDDGGLRGELDWEMVGGGEFDMVVYGEDCRWTAPELRTMTREEVARLARDLAIAIQARIDLWFPDGSVDLGPSRRR